MNRGYILAQRVGLDPFRPVVKVDIVILSRLLAPPRGFEPRTLFLHLFSSFDEGWTISFPQKGIARLVSEPSTPKIWRALAAGSHIVFAT